METENQPLDEEFLASENLPAIYSQKAIMGFSILMTPVFGGVLLMQNLKDIGKKADANTALLVSILFSAISFAVAILPEKPQTLFNLLFNTICAYILIWMFYKKYIPDDSAYQKKSIAKPLIIAIIITIPLIALSIWAINMGL